MGIASAAAQSGPVPRPLGPVIASTPAMFGTLSHVIELRDGRVLVHDARQRLIRMFDARLATPRIIIDSTSGIKNSYAQGMAAIFPAIADTVLFLDRTSQSFLVIDPSGQVVRVMATPPGVVVGPASTPLTDLLEGLPSVSPRYGFVFPARRGTLSPPAASIGPNGTVLNSAMVVLAMNPVTRAVDTLATLVTGAATRYLVSASGGVTANSGSSPLPHFDAWTVMADGSVAILRGRDYRIEWLDADGSRSQSPRIPYPWIAISDADRATLVDSVNTARRKAYEVGLAKRAADSAANPITYSTRNERGLPLSLTGILVVPPSYIEASMIPDFRPAFVRGAGRVFAADRDNNVWVLTKPSSTEPDVHVYDIVNRKGELVDRVRLPSGRVLLGFGVNGIVYLRGTDGGMQLLEKARVRD
jgi:hypothetical protein